MVKYKFTQDLIYSQVFSFEILNFFDLISTDDNLQWIIKYFNILLDNNNLISTKFNMHHIIPCFVFKDKNHKTRKDTQKLADTIKGNLIKLSIYNHMLAHFYLWKIFNNESSRLAIHIVFFKKNISHLSENKIKKIAKIQEEYRKSTLSKEERKEHILFSKKNYRNNNHKSIADYNLNYRLHPCFDPIRNEYCTQHTLEARKYRNKELYKNIKIKECLIKTDETKNLINEIKESKIILEEERWNIIQSSNINFQKEGWGKELSKLFGIPYNDCGIYVKRHFPNFYKTCYVYSSIKKKN